MTQDKDKMKTHVKKELKKKTVKEVIMTLHDNFTFYNTKKIEIESNNAEIQKQDQKVKDIISKKIKSKDMDKLNKLYEKIEHLRKDSIAINDAISKKEPEFIGAQELISRATNIKFQTNVITSIIALSVWISENKEKLNTKVNELI